EIAMLTTGSVASLGTGVGLVAVGRARRRHFNRWWEARGHPELPRHGAGLWVAGLPVALYGLGMGAFGVLSGICWEGGGGICVVGGLASAAGLTMVGVGAIRHHRYRRWERSFRRDGLELDTPNLEFSQRGATLSWS